MLKSEYLRFLQTINSNDISADVRKMANFVLGNLSTLAQLSTAQGQRIKKIVELAQASWATVSTEISPLDDRSAAQASPFMRLKNLVVGPFRGFAKSEEFDLSSDLVLIYGPNGTGKSSFCEAMEYCFLGTVVEAENKRFQNSQDYLKNAHTNSFERPVLVGVDSQGNDTPIAPDEAIYRFCFIDKNRIDSFARIAAQPPAKQTELISTLFGLELFSEFVRNFTDSMDDRYIDLTGVKKKALEQKQQVLAAFRQQLDETIPAELKRLDEEEASLANQYREGCSFQEMVSELNGTAEAPGLIQQLDEQIRKPVGQKSNLTLSSLRELEKTIKSRIDELDTKRKELTGASQQVSFKLLYEAVSQIQPNSPENCPACKTPLSQVATDPYAHADAELNKLQHLSELQKAIGTLEEEASKSLAELLQILKTCCTRFPHNNILLTLQDVNSPELWNSIHSKLTDGFTPWQHIETQVGQLEKADAEINVAEKKRVENLPVLQRLRQYAEAVLRLQTRRETAASNATRAKEAIAKFNTDNAQLIADSESEKEIVVLNRTIAEAYGTFVQRLNAYNNALPAQLVSDLGETVVLLYNAFNRNDGQHEKLADIRLPLSQNQRLEISFLKDPKVYFDALHILSEGHIRCIGLAILAAKNIKQSCPILVFDDPVNAIDDEHRQAIRETLFVEKHFEGKQLILAVHGEEFFNRTLQVIGKKAASATNSYVFSPRDGQYHIQVNSLNRPKNYVLAACELYSRGEYRDSLMSARRGLENLCDRTWYHYSKYCDKSDSLISVARRAPNQPWDLRLLSENLKSKFSRSKADIPNKKQIVTAFAVLLGENAKQPPWTYLNKGTHDEIDLPEFEQQIIELIISALEDLDRALAYSS